MHMIVLVQLILLATGISETTASTPQPVIVGEKDQNYWQGLSDKRFMRDCERFPSLKNAKSAKNVIMLLGDGMGLPTISASRFYIAETKGQNGSAYLHPFEEWPFNTMARTYDLETMVTDSASSATAYLTGSKTRTGMIGIDGNVGFKQCGAWPKESYTESVLEAAVKAKKATGIITTTRVTHASPAGCYGHVTYRDMESDADIKRFCPKEASEMICQDLACELARYNPDINIIIGGGQKNFYPTTESLPADPSDKGSRLDGQNLVNYWIHNQRDKDRNHCFIGKPSDLSKCDFDKADYVLGLPYASHMPYAHDLTPGDPDLLDYVEQALKVLKRQKNGFFLFIESGRIDHAHHENDGRHALDEMLHFDEVINYLQQNVNMDETLIIVTADHSHSFELVGQPGRFMSVLDLDHYYSQHTKDKMPLQGMNYMNGPNGLMNGGRKNPAVLDRFAWKYMQQSLVPFGFSTHGGDDVGVYAKGPMSAIFHTTVDNTMIANTMKLALGVAPYDKRTSPCQF